MKSFKSLLSASMLFLAVFLLHNAQYAAAMPSAGHLVAHWPLNHGSGITAADISGNSKDGVLINNPVWNNNKLVFDGANDYVNVGTLDVPGTALTLTGWVQANQLENCAARDCRILSKAIGTATQDHYWMVGTIKVGNTTRLRFRLKANGSTTTLVASTGDLTNGEQFHVAAVYDGTTMRLYKNGVDVGNTPKTGSIDTNNAVAVWIGGNPTVDTVRPWEGSIADVRIYQKALTKSEVNDVKNGFNTSDTTQPIINNIRATVTATTATITWNTNESANSQVSYGSTIAHENGTINKDSLVLSHNLMLTGLTPETTYHYQVGSTDASGNNLISNDLTFTTDTTDTGSNLVAHWPLNEGNGSTAVDISGNGNNAVLTNDPVWNGNKLVFDGANDYVDAGTLDISGTALTLTGWVQANQLENCAARDCRILSKAIGIATQDHYWMVGTIKVGSATRLRFRLKTNGSTHTLIASTGDLSNGELFHVAAIYDGSTMRLYKNGIDIGNTAKTGSIDTNNTVRVWIGGNPTVATGRPWDGSIADVRIYQKALTESEIIAVKNEFDTSDTTPPVINNIQATVSNTTATITWYTDEVANSLVDYGLNYTHGTTANAPALTTFHSIILTGLAAGTEYHYLVSSTDGSGNLAKNVDLTFTTTATTDTTLPIIRNIQTTVTNTTATITWDTDEVSDSVVEYGLNKTYGSTTSDPDPSTIHRIILTGLTADTIYHFVVSSSDVSGNIANSDNLTLTTAEIKPPVESDVNLVAHWPLNEGNGTIAVDISGNRHNAVLTNNPVWNGNELLFDGDNDYVDAGTIDVSGTELTLTAWIQANQLENCAAQDCRILSKASGTATNDHYWMVGTTKVGTTTRLRFRLKTNGSTKTLVATTGNLTNGDQFHVAAVYDGVTMRLYKNGIEVGSVAKTGNIDTNNTVETWIGGNPTDAHGRPWEGSIANVRIYQKALTATEVIAVKDNDKVTDITSPLIQKIKVSTTETTATVTWKTSEVANSDLSYGSSSAYENGNVRDRNMLVSHRITLTGLTSDTTYHYQLVSTDVNGNSSTSADLTFTTFISGGGSDLLIYDLNGIVTRKTHGFPRDEPPLASANGDWTTPVNYAEGTLHMRAEVKNQPVSQSMLIQFCFWQYNLTLENCARKKLVEGTSGFVLTWQGTVTSMYMKNRIPIDWKNPRQRYGLAIKNSAGVPISDYNGWNWGGLDPDEVYPLDMRFTVVVVPKGQTFSGWGNFIE
ncbi:MAG: LamG-like jellyroll fold domain-containing protein [Methylococcales bacterium]